MTLEAKTKELIAIGASITAHCQPCLTYHLEKAREAGASDDEVRDAIAVGHQVEKGSMSIMREFSAGVADPE